MTKKRKLLVFGLVQSVIAVLAFFNFGKNQQFRGPYENFLTTPAFADDIICQAGCWQPPESPSSICIQAGNFSSNDWCTESTGSPSSCIDGTDSGLCT